MTTEQRPIKAARSCEGGLISCCSPCCASLTDRRGRKHLFTSSVFLLLLLAVGGTVEGGVGRHPSPGMSEDVAAAVGLRG